MTYFIPHMVLYQYFPKIIPNLIFYRNEIGYWGSFPGDYKIDRTETFSVYGYDDNDASNLLSVKTKATNSYKVEQYYDNITYNPLVTLKIIILTYFSILDRHHKIPR